MAVWKQLNKEVKAPKIAPSDNNVPLQVWKRVYLCNRNPDKYVCRKETIVTLFHITITAHLVRKMKIGEHKMLFHKVE